MKPIAILLSLLTCASATTETDPRFIPATQGNTSPACKDDSDNTPGPFIRVSELPVGGKSWHWWGTSLAFHSQKDANAPMLKTHVAGLAPGSIYEVGSVFLLDTDAKSDPKKPAWGIRAGISLAGIEGFSTKSRTPLPDLIGLDHPDGKVRPWEHPEAGGTNSGMEKAPAGLKPYVASLGHYKTDAEGTLVIYVDDVAGGMAGMISAYSGLWITPAKDGTAADVGGGDASGMVRAARAGDWETVRREIKAGADLNKPDAEGLTPLFYACLADDVSLIEELLRAGAHPDPKGQSLDPLWAAAKLANPKTVKLLLDAGARIDTRCLSERNVLFSEALVPKWEDTKANPVSAAIRSGCVDTLKVILNHWPDLDLEKSMYGDAYAYGKNSYNTRQPEIRDLISDAVNNKNSAMAAFLIERGFRIDIRKSPELVANESTPPGFSARTLMLAAVFHEPPMTEVIDALSKRGEPVVRDISVEHDPFIIPWDALSAAVWEGHPELVQKWLPLADGTDPKYKARLAELADVTPCRESGALVRKHFPDARMETPTGWKTPTLDAKTSLVVDARELKPRRTLPKHVAAREGKDLTLAVLASDEASGPADMLSVQASADASWKVIDRNEISKLLTERAIRTTSTFDSAMLNEIGDRFSADVIVLASMIGSGEEALIHFEAHSVATGLPFFRTYTLAKSYKPEAHSIEFLKQIRERNLSVDAGNPPNAITFLGVSPAAGLTQGRSLQGVLNSGLLQAIDMTDGMIAMTREQITPLVEEQALAAKGGLWGAMWTLEGGVRPIKDTKRIVLELRLSALDRNETFDVAVEGLPEAPRELVHQAWAQIMAAMKRQGPAPDADGSRAKREGERLLREAQYLISGTAPWEAKPYAEAALFLGANRLESLMIRKNARVARWTSKNRLLLENGGGYGYPVCPHIQEYDAGQLDEALDVLRLTSESLEQVFLLPGAKTGNVGFARVESFWKDLDQLVQYRCRLVIQRLAAGQSEVLVEFDREMSIFVKKLLPHTIGMRNRGRRFAWLQRVSDNFRPVPWLGKILAEDIYQHAASHRDPKDMMYFLDGSSPCLRPYIMNLPFNVPRFDLMAKVLEQAIHPTMPFYQIRKAEIDYLASSGKDRQVKARVSLKSWAEIMNSTSSVPGPLIDTASLSYSLPACRTYEFESLIAPNPINYLVVSKVDNPDTLFRFPAYLESRREYLEVAASGDRARSLIKQNMVQTTDFWIKKFIEKKSPAGNYHVLEEAALNKDRLIGLGSCETIIRKIRASQPATNDDTSGSDSGSRVAGGHISLPGSILADLREISPTGHPLICFARVDPKHNHLLWLALHMLPEPELALHVAIINDSEPKIEVGSAQPWLVAVDCRDGSVVHRVNLAEVALPGISVKLKNNFYVGQFLSPGITFNDHQLMVLFRWEKTGFEDWRSQQERLVTVDRISGKAAVMPPLQHVVDSQLQEYGGRPWPAMVGLGRDFYVLEDSEHEGYARRQNTMRHRALWKFSETGLATKLTEPGRRPASTPFDSEDRNPKMLRVDGKRILVASSWNDFAHYDPDTGKWHEAEARTETKWANYIYQIDRRFHHSWQFPSFALRVNGKAIGVTVQPANLETGRLVFEQSGNLLRVPVNLNPPSGYNLIFIANPDFDSKSHNRDPRLLKKISLDEFLRSPIARPILVNQTDNHFIVALRIAVDSSFLSHHEPVLLPFLWKIDREALTSTLESGSK